MYLLETDFPVANWLHRMSRFDVRKIRKLDPPKRYSELYYHWRKAEEMIASNIPDARRYGRRLKRRVEKLYSDWFGSFGQAIIYPTQTLWASR
jgi:hypothetical protein